VAAPFEAWSWLYVTEYITSVINIILAILTEEKLATVLYVMQKGKVVPVHATRHIMEV
jgi:hypothetical protein